MDKYEYQVCAEQIKTLINERRYAEAMNIADTIDWRKVRSVAMLCTVSEVYKINKKYEEARDILFLAYDRYPGGRTIVYALCELAIKLNDVIQAKELYEEYVRLAPEDTSRYILLYKLYEALDVSIEERIEVLEEFKKTDYRERWAYELAYLYHKIGQETKCVQECDELILWFGDGKYVKQAMDLKMQHTRLSKEQQLKYEGRQEPMSDKFMNLQQTPVQQIYDTDPQAGNPQQIPMQPPYETRFTTGPYMSPVQDSQPLFIQEPVSMQGQDMQITAEPISSVQQRTAQMLNTSEIDSIQVQPVNVGMYNTMDLQNGLSENIKKFFERENAQALDENVKLSANPESYEKLYERNTMSMPEGLNDLSLTESNGPIISVRELNPSENELDDVPDREEDVQMTMFMPASEEMNASMQYYAQPANTGEMYTEEQALTPSEEAMAVMDAVRAHDERNAYPAPVVTADGYPAPIPGQEGAPMYGAGPEEETEEEDVSSEAETEETEETEAAEDTLKEEKAEEEADEAGDGEEEDHPEAAGEEDTEEDAEDAGESEEEEEDKKPQADEAKAEEAPAEEKDKPSAQALPDDDEIYRDDLDSIYKSWEDKKRESEEKRIQEAKEKSLVWTTDIMAQLKGVLPEIDDIAKTTPPRVVTSVDTGEMPSVEPVFKPYRTTAPGREIKPASVSIPLPVDEIEQEMQDFAKKSEEPEDDSAEEKVTAEEKAEDKELGDLEDLSEDLEETADEPEDDEEDIEDTDDESGEDEEEAEDSDDESEEDEEEAEDSDDKSEEDEEEAEDTDDESEDDEEDTEDTDDESEDDGEEAEDTEDESGEDEEDTEDTDDESEEDEEDTEDTDDESGDDVEDEGSSGEDGSEEEDKDTEAGKEADTEKPGTDETDEEVDYSSMEISYDPHDDMGFDPEKLDVSVATPKNDIDYLNNTDPGNDIYFREIMNMDDSEEEVFGDETAGINEDAADDELTYSEDEEAARKAAFEITSELPEYPYESLEDYGEVEEIEVIEQPEGLDGIMKTNDLPLDDIARANYEAGIEPEEDESETPKVTPSKKKKHPSYMKLEKAPVSKREFDKQEQLVFGRFEGIEWLKAQIVNCIDNIDMDPSRGNVLVMGTEASGRRSIAIDVVKVMQSLEDGFKGKVAKISGEALNKKDIPLTIKKLRHGALIVENSEGLTPSSARIVAEALELETEPVLVVMEGDTAGVTKLINASRDIFDRVFNSRIELQDFTTDDLVAYGKGYAHEKEYTIDEMGVLALYRRVGDMQTLDHIVTLEEVREIVDNAIKHVDKKNMSHFMDVLLAKRYDDDDYIILREKDFIV